MKGPTHGKRSGRRSRLPAFEPSKAVVTLEALAGKMPDRFGAVTLSDLALMLIGTSSVPVSLTVEGQPAVDLTRSDLATLKERAVLRMGSQLMKQAANVIVTEAEKEDRHLQGMIQQSKDDAEEMRRLVGECPGISMMRLRKELRMSGPRALAARALLGDDIEEKRVGDHGGDTLRFYPRKGAK